MRGVKVRTLMAATGMSRGYCDQLLRIVESGDLTTLAHVFNREITVHAAFLAVTGRGYDQHLAKRFNSIPVAVREELLSLID
jgi:hypothetical protein